MFQAFIMFSQPTGGLFREHSLSMAGGGGGLARIGGVIIFFSSGMGGHQK